MSVSISTAASSTPSALPPILDSNSIKLFQDPLTGVANRVAFEFELGRRMSGWSRHRTPIGIAAIDIDKLCRVNDIYGLPSGDAAIRAVAGAILSSTRAMDLVARVGGDEFAVLLPATTPHEVREVTQRIRSTVAALQLRLEKELIPLTVSVGVATMVKGDTHQTLLKRAEAAVVAAKRSGRDRVFFNDGRDCRIASSIVPKSPIQLPIPEKSHLLPTETTIAIVDDEPSTILTVKKYLRDAGYERFVEISDATKAVETIKAQLPDIVMLDIHMPEVCGLEILEELKKISETDTIPVLIFTSDRKSDAKVNALNLGANDFLQKPLDPSELLARVRNTLLAKARMDDLENHSQRLEHEVRVRTTELAASRREAIQCLARAGELRDDQTGRHVIRVGRYARIIAEALDFAPERADWLELAAQLHDVGKIGIPDSVLRKEGPLDEDEYRLIKEHCNAGQHIIHQESQAYEAIGSHTQNGMEIFDDCNSPIMRMAAVIASTHHEKWDGSGYPQGLSGAEIPIEGRITAVADVFDALSTKRPYKEALPINECFQLLEDGRGSHFDPEVLDAFLSRKLEIMQTFHDFADA